MNSAFERREQVRAAEREARLQVDDLTAAAEAYARMPSMNVGTVRDRIAEAYIAGWEAARDHLAAQEPTDAEVLDALNAQGVIVSPKVRPAPSLDCWGERQVEAMRATLVAARAVRQETR